MSTKTVKSNASDVYVLKFPFEYEGENVTELKLRRLKAKDYIAMDNEFAALKLDPEQAGENRHKTMLLAKVTGKPFELIEELDAADYIGLQAAWGNGFFL